MLKRRRKGLVLFIAAFMAIVVFSGVCTASAETTDELNTQPVDKFMLWLYEKDARGEENEKVAGYSKDVVTWETDDSHNAITDVLKIQDTNEYLIPIKYFQDNYKNSGYTFDENEPCPFVYAPDAADENKTANLILASYVKVDDDWYVKVEDTGNYNNPDNPRSNIYYCLLYTSP